MWKVARILADRTAEREGGTSYWDSRSDWPQSLQPSCTECFRKSLPYFWRTLLSL